MNNNEVCTKKIESMKESLAECFNVHIHSLNTEELYKFICATTDNLQPALDKQLELPKNLFLCNDCKEMYGECYTEQEVRLDANKEPLCRERFMRYCEEE